MKVYSITFISFILFFLLIPSHQKTYAYTSGIAATTVIGQKDFVSSQANQGGSASSQSVSSPSAAIVVGSQLLVADAVNNRVLVYNNIPTNNNQAADVVIGQPDMTTTSSGCTQSKFNLGDGGIFFAGGKLFVADANNNRVLIFNSIPSGNGTNANLVLGQSSFTGCSANVGGISAKTMSGPTDITSDGAKLFISDSGNNRVLGYLSIPSSNNAAADFVVGQPDSVTATANTNGIGDNTLNTPKGIALYKGILLVADMNNFRVLVFDTTPTVTNDTADVVIGQSTFVSSSALTVSSQTLQPIRLSVDANGLLYIADRQAQRVLIYNSIPIANNAAASLVIGQQNFTASTANNGGIGTTTLSSPKSAISTYTQLVITDSVNNRVLIYPNSLQTPSVNVSNGLSGNADDTVTVNGTATVSSPYTISDVSYSANGDGFAEATAVSGSFHTTSEPFTLSFDPLANNNQTAGYTLRIRAIDTNGDISPYVFFFSPFATNAPEDNSIVTTSYPVFDFSVSTQRSLMKNNVHKYQIWVRKSGTALWQLYLDNIPSDFAAVKTNSDNTKRSQYLNLDTNNGTYDNANLDATYAEESSHILVYAKESTPTSFEQGGKALAGSYAWKVVSVDNSGHAFESDWRYIRVNASQTIDKHSFFPLTILSLSGLGNPNISSLHADQIQNSYTTKTSAPIFYGIAASGSFVTLILTNPTCNDPTQCTQSFTTIANEKSRFGINIPNGTLTPEVPYTVSLNASLNEDYVELPGFSLVYSATTKNVQGGESMIKKSSTFSRASLFIPNIYSPRIKRLSSLSSLLPFSSFLL